MSGIKRDDTLALVSDNSNKDNIRCSFQFDFVYPDKPLLFLPNPLVKDLAHRLMEAYPELWKKHLWWAIKAEDGRLRIHLTFSGIVRDFSDEPENVVALQANVVSALAAIDPNFTIVQAEPNKPSFSFASLDGTDMNGVMALEYCPTSRYNLTVLRQAEVAYLTRLADLQASIAAEFSAKLKPKGKAIDLDDDWEAQEKIDEAHPLPPHVDSLWYS